MLEKKKHFTLANIPSEVTETLGAGSTVVDIYVLHKLLQHEALTHTELVGREQLETCVVFFAAWQALVCTLELDLGQQLLVGRFDRLTRRESLQCKGARATSWGCSSRPRYVMWFSDCTVFKSGDGKLR